MGGGGEMRKVSARAPSTLPVQSELEIGPSVLYYTYIAAILHLVLTPSHFDPAASLGDIAAAVIPMLISSVPPTIQSF